MYFVNINVTVLTGDLAGHPRVAHVAMPGVYVDTRDLNSGPFAF